MSSKESRQRCCMSVKFTVYISIAAKFCRRSSVNANYSELFGLNFGIAAEILNSNYKTRARYAFGIEFGYNVQ